MLVHGCLRSDVAIPGSHPWAGAMNDRCIRLQVDCPETCTVEHTVRRDVTLAQSMQTCNICLSYVEHATDYTDYAAEITADAAA